MNQLTLALAECDKGIVRIASRNGAFIETARGIARMIGKRQRTFTMDDVREEMEKRGITPTHFNAWGAVCAGKEWRKEFAFMGYTKSRQIQGHGNLIRVWSLRGYWPDGLGIAA